MNLLLLIGSYFKNKALKYVWNNKGNLNLEWLLGDIIGLLIFLSMIIV